jgi:ATP-dependent helicase/nuclease subunit A
MSTAIDRANAEQRVASDPRVSAFVAASAGSGKTKLLTDRLLRLLLDGVPPDKILCLTYTKAAAAEMTIRLNRRLGQWVVMPPERLAAELRTLDIAPTPELLARAKKSFGVVLDLPGGMRIGTIHAFCQSLLRRFPLEAQLSPHFEVADDAAAAARLREAREAVLGEPAHRDAIFALAAYTDERRFAELTAEFAQDPGIFGRAPAGAIAAMQRAALGVDEARLEALGAAAVSWSAEADVTDALRRIADAGTNKGKTWAGTTLAWLARNHHSRWRSWEEWVGQHFTQAGKARSLEQLLGAKLAAELEKISGIMALECARINAVQEQKRALELAEINENLARLLAPILDADKTAKTLAARLSYGDLIERTGQLLVDPGAAWVLYKLDGGIDHLLLDEVQDTAPRQWDIADAIAAEFFAGTGARAQTRTVFAVGDAKQSIFSFQGADLASFVDYADKFARRAKAAGAAWVDGKLSVSFRSTAPVLALVDAVFEDGHAREGVCQPGETLAHGVSRAGQGGRVTLWPLTEAAAPAPLPDWAVPDDYTGGKSAKTSLADEIAGWIAERLARGDNLPSRGRPVSPGDFLILVRRRDDLVTAITAAARARKIPMAGLDRMVLLAQPAVSDLLALCDALLLPENDLALAQFLASPLGGLADDSLMRLALGRRGFLVNALYARAEEDPAWARAKNVFEALRAKLDFATPFALLSEALWVQGGRTRLLARLGPEAAEPIDEFLAEALAFGQTSPASLQLFVHQFRQSGSQIRREADAAGDVVRIMTVHGAKGLQAPIVILPDTTGLPKQEPGPVHLPVPQQPGETVPVFCPDKSLRAEAVAAAMQRRAEARRAEYNRLLYVALTRAEDELLVCGAKGAKAVPETSWYMAVQAGFSRLDAQADTAGRLVYECPQTAPPDRVSARAISVAATLPAWAGQAPDFLPAPPARETTRPERLAPSRGTEDAAKQAIAASPLGDGPALARQARLAAMEKGRAVHALLQHLPDISAASRPAAALRYLERQPALAGQAPDIVAAVLRILDAPELSELFGPGSRAEIPLAGIIGDVEIGGLVDRLVVTPQAVIIADYKTDRAPPADAAGIPAKYLQQLAAYRAVLRQIYPARAVRCVLIWTATAQAMTIPAAALDAAAPA